MVVVVVVLAAAFFFSAARFFTQCVRVCTWLTYSRSMTAAAPMPVPMHMLMTPNFFPWRFNSGRRVAI